MALLPSGLSEKQIHLNQDRNNSSPIRLRWCLLMSIQCITIVSLQILPCVNYYISQNCHLRVISEQIVNQIEVSVLLSKMRSFTPEEMEASLRFVHPSFILESALSTYHLEKSNLSIGANLQPLGWVGDKPSCIRLRVKDENVSRVHFQVTECRQVTSLNITSSLSDLINCLIKGMSVSASCCEAILN